MPLILQPRSSATSFMGALMEDDLIKLIPADVEGISIPASDLGSLTTWRLFG
jgi:hypothetical protein